MKTPRRQFSTGEISNYFADAPATLKVSSIVSETLSSYWPGLMLKSPRLMLKLARMTSRSPFRFGTRWNARCRHGAGRQSRTFNCTMRRLL